MNLLSGPRGHPNHPPLTDAAIGAFTAATVLACLSTVGVHENSLAQAWYIVLLIGLGFAALAAVTGLNDLLTRTDSGSAARRTGYLHMGAMLLAVALFVTAAGFGYDGWLDTSVTGWELSLTLAGWAVLTLGGWLGGTLVYVHGLAVLDRRHEPTGRATTMPRERGEDVVVAEEGTAGRADVIVEPEERRPPGA